MTRARWAACENGKRIMRLSVIGCGYLGAVHATCMAALGHEVIGVDVDPVRISTLAADHAPFYEPGLPELLGSVAGSGRLQFTTDIARASGAAVHFLCVGTPQLEGELRADLSHLHAASRQLLPLLQPGDVVVGKSTVPVGTAEALAGLISERGATLVWNPEFLREGCAVEDTLHPDRIVYGLPTEQGVPTEAGIKAQAVLDQVYSVSLSDGVAQVITDYATAQLVKVAANSFLATKISFINAMAELCEASGGDVTDLADAIGYDNRIGRRFLSAGLGFGGGCLPKDIRAFAARAGELGVGDALSFLSEVDKINQRRRARMVDLTREVCGGSIVGKKVTVLGVTFKPDTDDIRDSPALSVARQLVLEGALVTVTDPRGLDQARRVHPDLRCADDLLEASQGADVVVLGTEWEQYRMIEPDVLAQAVHHRRMLDGRNALDADAWRSAGWTYRALGRPHWRPTTSGLDFA